MTDKQNICASFVKAQQGFAPALKSATNPHFRSKYVQLDACIEAVIDALHENGIALMQRTFEDSTGVTVETVFIHESGQFLEGGRLHVPAGKQDPQGYGSALTYARRYSLMAACGIAPEDDDGNASSKAPKSQPTPSELAMEWIGALDGAQTLDELKKLFAQAWQATKQNKAVKQHYDNLKSKFEGEQA